MLFDGTVLFDDAESSARRTENDLDRLDHLYHLGTNPACVKFHREHVYVPTSSSL